MKIIETYSSQFAKEETNADLNILQAYLLLLGETYRVPRSIRPSGEMSAKIYRMYVMPFGESRSRELLACRMSRTYGLRTPGRNERAQNEITKRKLSVPRQYRAYPTSRASPFLIAPFASRAGCTTRQDQRTKARARKKRNRIN